MTGLSRSTPSRPWPSPSWPSSFPFWRFFAACGRTASLAAGSPISPPRPSRSRAFRASSPNSCGGQAFLECLLGLSLVSLALGPFMSLCLRAWPVFSGLVASMEEALRAGRHIQTTRAWGARIECPFWILQEDMGGILDDSLDPRERGGSSLRLSLTDAFLGGRVFPRLSLDNLDSYLIEPLRGEGGRILGFSLSFRLRRIDGANGPWRRCECLFASFAMRGAFE